ncbi:uncharacterized protein G2W53_010730 [Senna tora]|uniref:Uncharacterized protein n=1 Tax=Senna tora TaxID=362788 RepID=A0A835C9S8_9FABA|nr:uncharacterized protein G2W53_010730 [Senna tora]
MSTANLSRQELQVSDGSIVEMGLSSFIGVSSPGDCFPPASNDDAVVCFDRRKNRKERTLRRESANGRRGQPEVTTGDGVVDGGGAEINEPKGRNFFASLIDFDKERHINTPPQMRYTRSRNAIRKIRRRRTPCSIRMDWITSVNRSLKRARRKIDSDLRLDHWRQTYDERTWSQPLFQIEEEKWQKTRVCIRKQRKTIKEWMSLQERQQNA